MCGVWCVDACLISKAHRWMASPRAATERSEVGVPCAWIPALWAVGWVFSGRPTPPLAVGWAWAGVWVFSGRPPPPRSVGWMPRTPWRMRRKSGRRRSSCAGSMLRRDRPKMQASLCTHTPPRARHSPKAALRPKTSHRPDMPASRPKASHRPETSRRPETSHRPEMSASRPETPHRPETSHRPEMPASRPKASRRPETSHRPEMPASRPETPHRLETSHRPEMAASRPKAARRPMTPASRYIAVLTLPCTRHSTQIQCDDRVHATHFRTVTEDNGTARHPRAEPLGGWGLVPQCCARGARHDCSRDGRA